MELSRFSRGEMLIGKEAAEKLARCHVAVFGLGGVGSYTAEALARAGVGELTVVDNDEISITNINRQLYALTSTVGMKKTQVAAERIKDINPECKVNIIDGFYLEDNSADFFEGSYDYIADAVDTVQAKLSLAAESQRRGIPLISCMGTGNKLDPTLFRVSDISKTSVPRDAPRAQSAGDKSSEGRLVARAADKARGDRRGELTQGSAREYIVRPACSGHDNGGRDNQRFDKIV